MKRRATILRVSLATTIFLGLQAGLCAGACAVAAVEPAQTVASAGHDCHVAAEPENTEPGNTHSGDALHSDSTEWKPCCSALRSTSAANPASISSLPLSAVAPSLESRAPASSATPSGSGDPQRPIPTRNILLLKSTLLL